MHFIDGKWQEGAHDTFVSINPATNETIWEGTHAGAQEVERALIAAQRAFPSWSATSIEERIGYLGRFEEILKEEKGALALIISQETGKCLWEAFIEVDGMIGKIATSIEAYQSRCESRAISVNNGILKTLFKPHGVVAILAPFNFPGHLPNGHLIPALLAGNCAVIKSSHHTPLTLRTIFQCWEKVGLPPGVINLLQGGGETGELIANHPKIDGLFFTGSYEVGAKLCKELPPHKILALEMGGNNPLVVSELDELEAASYLTILSAYITSGQRCSCARRLIVVKSKKNQEYLKILTQMIGSIQVGSYDTTPEPFMGPLISMEIVEKLLAAQAVLGASGGKSLVEMRPLQEKRPFLSPGLMDVTAVKHRADQELFGPFLQLIWAENFNDAIRLANQTEYGLSASLLSCDESQYAPFFNQVNAGVINFNAPTTGANAKAPFGGIKKSGNHRPSGYFASDYCSYPIASLQHKQIQLPERLAPGVDLLATT